MLDAIQQRIVGVLIEKERTVPDGYPLTENALLAGCNQKSNRDPEMDLDATAIHPAILALREDGWIARIEGNRATRYRHRIEERLNVSRDQQAVLCELLLRGPQTPGALKPRVARLGFHAEPDAILRVLHQLAEDQPTPLVERQPRRPRERDSRWGHLLGPPAESWLAGATDEADDVEAPSRSGPDRPPAGAGGERTAVEALAARVDRLEADLADLRALVERLTSP
ncbi:MAG: DUF480 domain-containing protein [Planctomycetes bacterium]|nr:DUF480 domain-containing protein [Planctomycetota bacterium]